MQKLVAESWLVVSLAAVFAIMLAGTQVALRSTIAANDRAVLEAAIADVTPDFAERVKSIRSWVDHAEVVNGKRVSNDIYECLGPDEKPVGWVVKASGAGFIDQIELVVGLTADHKSVTGIKVIKSVETPGLGDNINQGPYPEQYSGRTTDKPITVSKTAADLDQNVIHAITGATFSSNYTADIVNDVLQRVVPELDSLKADDAVTTSAEEEK